MGHKKTALTVQKIDPEAAVTFIRRYHYSKVLPRLNKYYLGIFEGGQICGVVLLGWGTQPLQTIRKIFPKHRFLTSDYLEMGKMCFLPEMNNTGYFGSFALSTLIHWVRDNADCLFFYTLADGIMGKCGYVYQASNFRYIGHFKTSVYRDTATGEKIHPRSAGQLLAENAALESVKKKYWLSHDFCAAKGIEKINGRMFRYIYPLTKEAAKILDSYPEYKSLPYPKDKDLYFAVRTGQRQYMQIPQPRFNRDICHYNSQKYGNERRNEA